MSFTFVSLAINIITSFVNSEHGDRDIYIYFEIVLHLLFIKKKKENLVSEKRQGFCGDTFFEKGRLV